MNTINRREFLGSIAASATLGMGKAEGISFEGLLGKKKQPVGMIHVTDLYRHHIDPDDHWDLASVFALAYLGEVDLRMVLIDYPAGRVVEMFEKINPNPDVMAVAQMNYIAGLNVPVAAGTPFLMKSRQDTQSYASSSQLSGVNAIINVLRESEKPVVINITGCCRDVAVAGKKEPKLFEKKCKAIYLNVGNTSSWKGTKLGEYNVSLDAISYAAIFELPCRIYWMPCVGYVSKDGNPTLNEYRTMYTINQGEMLSHLSDRMQNYFAYMFGVIKTPDWLTFLNGPRQKKIINSPKSQKDKKMWCTAGFFHAAGKTVLADGKVVPVEQANGKGIFSFEPVKVTCDDEGITKWSLDKNSKDRFIFYIRDVENYQSAMIKSLKELLITMT